MPGPKPKPELLSYLGEPTREASTKRPVISVDGHFLSVGQLSVQAGRPVCVGEVTSDQHVAPILIKQARQPDPVQPGAAPPALPAARPESRRAGMRGPAHARRRGGSPDLHPYAGIVTAGAGPHQSDRASRVNGGSLFPGHQTTLGRAAGQDFRTTDPRERGHLRMKQHWATDS